VYTMNTCSTLCWNNMAV